MTSSTTSIDPGSAAGRRKPTVDTRTPKRPIIGIEAGLRPIGAVLGRVLRASESVLLEQSAWWSDACDFAGYRSRPPRLVEVLVAPPKRKRVLASFKLA